MSGSPRLRILMVIPQLGYGGAEGDLIRLARYLAREADVTIALMARDYGGGDYSNAQEELDLPLVLLDGDRPVGRSILSKVGRWWRMLRNLRKLKSEHDVAISFLSGANLLNALAGPEHKTIVSERGSKLHHTGISARSKFLWLRVLDPLTYHRSGKVVAVSKGYATEVMQIAGPHARQKVMAIEGLVEADRLLAAEGAAVDTDIEIFCNGPVIVSCGRLDRGKGVHLLIPTFAKVRHRIPGARLLLIGDGPLTGSMQEKCASLGLSTTTTGDPSAAVFFSGYRAAPSRHYRLATVFVFPSLHEGLPNALIEALATGVPILSSDCPWGPRSVLSGPEDAEDDGPAGLPRRLEYGTLMPLPDTPGGLDVWCAEISRLLADPPPHRSRDECWRSLARFDIAVTGKAWRSLIDTLEKRNG